MPREPTVPNVSVCLRYMSVIAIYDTAGAGGTLSLSDTSSGAQQLPVGAIKA